MDKKIVSIAIITVALVLASTCISFAVSGYKSTTADYSMALAIMFFSFFYIPFMISAFFYVYYWIYYDAKSRGLNPIIWLLFSIVTGMIGLFAYYAYVRKGQVQVISRNNVSNLDNLHQSISKLSIAAFLATTIGYLLLHTGRHQEGIICLFLLAIITFPLSFKVLQWVDNDATIRGIEAIVWIVIIAYTGLIGLLIYYFVRPQRIR